ncbi:hypothetical protein [Adhaeribacter radiodurans]|uniref:Uncharacterized protein n=1 Tax=Adhaeribacter radiodurans TaxID=2745197 RepID=A0A7L7LCD1_9BACT|nr:hypothetical protein [Adhaeribacter radiodurans]QMU30500.1 hypothetical protein HUW48_21850 [Adhaeribacter radiodurans]
MTIIAQSIAPAKWSINHTHYSYYSYTKYQKDKTRKKHESVQGSEWLSSSHIPYNFLHLAD